MHHIFSKAYLKRHGMTRGTYNPIANYVYMQSEINIKVGSKAPHLYMSQVKEQVTNGHLQYSGLTNEASLHENLRLILNHTNHLPSPATGDYPFQSTQFCFCGNLL